MWNSAQLTPSKVTKEGKSAAYTDGECRYIALDVDARRLAGVCDLYMTIEYFDSGTDKLHVGVRSGVSLAGAAWTIDKTDTQTWKTYTGFKANACLYDVFSRTAYVDDNQDGDEWVHRVSFSLTPPFMAVDHMSELRDPAMLGKSVALDAKVCTQTWDTDIFWIEEEDRTSGIRVNPATGTGVPDVGDRVTVTGTVAEYYGVLALNNATFTTIGSGDPLKPLGMVNRAALEGPETDGLYVKMTGEVIAHDPGQADWFYINDGSPNQIRVIARPGTVTRPAVGSYVTVEGVLQNYNENGSIVPTLLFSNADQLGTP